MRFTSLAVIAGLAAIITATHDTGHNPILPPAIAVRHDDAHDALCSKPPKLCTGAVMLDGASTTLTYVCPEKTAAASTTTVHVTVTKTETVPGEISTGVGGPSKGPVVTPVEPTTTTTLHSTTTSTKTLTVSRKTTTRSALWTSLSSTSSSSSSSLISTSSESSSARSISDSTTTSSIIFLPPSPTAPFLNTTTSSFSTSSIPSPKTIWPTLNITLPKPTITPTISPTHIPSFPPVPKLHNNTISISAITHGTAESMIEDSMTGGYGPVQTANFARQVNTTSGVAHATGTGTGTGGIPTPTTTGSASLGGTAGHVGVEIGLIGLAGMLMFVFI